MSKRKEAGLEPGSKKSGVFVVTGGSRGLGKAIAVEAARAGYPIALIARSKKDLEAASSDIGKELAQSTPAVSIHCADLTKQSDVDRAFKEILDRHGKVRALVNNAATWMPTKAATEFTAEEIQRSLDLNFYSAFRPTKALLESRAFSELSIVNIGATSSLQGWPEVLAFCVGKGALRTYSQALARELGPRGIHVAHLIIDGILDNERTRQLNPKAKDEQFINLVSAAKSVLHVALQDKSCWTFEWDVRPYNENW